MHGPRSRFGAGAALVPLLAAACGGTAHTQTLRTNQWAQGVSGPLTAPGIAARARDAAAHDRLVRRLVGRRAVVKETFVWLGTSRQPAVVEVAYALDRPRSFDAVVPFALNPPDAPATGDCRSPYAPGWERLRAAGVRVVFVGVDVRLRRVVDIKTDASEVVSSVPGRPFPRCQETQ